MYHHYDVALNSKGGPTADVIIRAFNVADDSIAVMFADENSTPIESLSGIPNAAKSSADGNYDFFIADGFYNLRFYIGDALIQTVRNIQLQNSASVADVEGKAQATALGVAGTAGNLGTFTGTIIPDNQSAKQALQALETAVEGLPNAQVNEYPFVVTDPTQSLFTLPVTPTVACFVYQNGARLYPTDFTQVGANFTLVNAAVNGDVVVIVAGEGLEQPTVAYANIIGIRDIMIAASGAAPTRDYAADITGVANAVTPFTNMFAAGDNYQLADGAYRLNSDVTLGGDFTWIAQTGVSFVGTGVINATDFSGFNYAPDLRNISVAHTAGTIASPKTSPHAVMFVGANSSTVDTGGSPNPAFAVQHNMYATTGQARAQAIYAEAIARVSGASTFVEGARNHGIVPDGINSKAYGTLSYAQNGGTGANTIATESEIRRTSTVTVSTARDWTGAETWDGMFLATANSNNEVIGGPGSRPNFAFALNMYSTIAVRTGFLIPKSLQVGGKTVDHTAFANLETGLVYGLDLAKGSYSTAAIALPNNSTVRAYNAVGAAEHNLLYYDTSNRLVLGEEAAAGVFVKGAVGFQGTAPIAKPTVTGSRGGNAALASVLTQLAAYGLITDGTTA